MTDLFADSYAFLAAADGSKAYHKVLAENDIVTSHAHALEVAYGLLHRDHVAALEATLRPVLALCITPPSAVVKDAAIFRHERRSAGANCSYTDAWGYATARSMDIPFLTGDEGFRGVPGVKFLKA